MLFILDESLVANLNLLITATLGRQEPFIEKNKFWEVIDELQTLGAEGILVAPIEKMVL